MSYTQYYGDNTFDKSSSMEAGTHLWHQQEKPNSPQASQYSSFDSPPIPTNANPLTQNDFLKQIGFTKQQSGELLNHINQISALHSRALNSPDPPSSRLEDIVTQAHAKINQIRDFVKYLERDGKNNTWKEKHTKQVKIDFQDKLRKYQGVEMDYRQGCRDQIARQYRIINPKANEDEIKEVSEMDWGSEGVFQTALNSGRSGQVSSALGAVRARHNELQKIEQTLSELAAIFMDMAQLVDVQEDNVEQTKQNGKQTKEAIQRANDELAEGVEKIRNRNKLRRWCILITILIILVITLGVGLGIGLNAKKPTS